MPIDPNNPFFLNLGPIECNIRADCSVADTTLDILEIISHHVFDLVKDGNQRFASLDKELLDFRKYVEKFHDTHPRRKLYGVMAKVGGEWVLDDPENPRLRSSDERVPPRPPCPPDPQPDFPRCTKIESMYGFPTCAVPCECKSPSDCKTGRYPWNRMNQPPHPATDISSQFRWPIK